MEKSKVICSNCGKEVNEFDVIIVNGEILCEDCLDEKYTYCSYHHDYEPANEVRTYTAYDGTEYDMCEYGSYDFFTRCDDCGRLVPTNEIRYNDDSDELCPECYQRHLDERVIKYYHASHEVPRQFFGEATDGIYMGFEIETERKYDEDKSLNKIAKAVKDDHTDNLLFFENDGSLDDGFETITNPLSYEFIVNNNILESIVDSLSNHGMHTSGRCGLHIHVTRNKAVEDKLPSILMFMENNKEDMIKFSGRSDYSFNEWCSFYTDMDEDIILLDSLRIIATTGQRHMCLNVTNKETVEFRCFAGTLDANKVMAYMEFVQLMIKETFKNFKGVYSEAKKYGYTNLTKLLEANNIGM